MSAATGQRPARYMTRAQRDASRRRANARSRALVRLAHEFVDRYRQLYAEELEASS